MMRVRFPSSALFETPVLQGFAGLVPNRRPRPCLQRAYKTHSGRLQARYLHLGKQVPANVTASTERRRAAPSKGRRMAVMPVIVG